MKDHPINYLGPGGKTWNPAIGCLPGMPCSKQCWARKMAVRLAASPNKKLAAAAAEALSADGSDWSGRVHLFPERLDQARTWRTPRRIAVQFMGDIACLPEDYLREIWLVMEDCPRHTFLLLTKQAGALAEILNPFSRHNFGELPNVWIGVSVSSMGELWRIDVLRRIPAVLRWVSFEPLTITDYHPALELRHIDWVVIGAGRGYPPIALDVVRSIAGQCRRRDIPVWVKQLNGPTGGIVTELDEFPEDLRMRKLPR